MRGNREHNQDRVIATNKSVMAKGGEMAISTLMKRAQARWWLIMVLAQVHMSAAAMAVVEYEPTSGGYRSAIFSVGALAAILTRSEHHELLKAYAPNMDAFFKWFFRIGVTLIAMELILDQFGTWVYTREPGETLLGIWSFGRMGLACYVSGIAAHINDKKSF